EIIEVERLRRLAALDQRRPWLRDGCLSTTAWLAERFRMAHGAAAADVRMARALEAIPATREAASSGEISVSAVRVLVSAREADARSGNPHDGRSHAQRRADALGEICRQWLDAADRPESGGERPHLTITLQAGAIRGLPGAATEFMHVGPVPSHVARQLACDA